MSYQPELWSHFMSFIPAPLHPFVVHFPVCLLMLGLAMSFLCIFWSKYHLPVYTLICLALGAVTASIADAAAEMDLEQTLEISESISALISAHHEWGEAVIASAWLAAALALLSLVLAKRKALILPIRCLTFIVLLYNTYVLYETGSRGAELVHVHHFSTAMPAKTDN